MGNEWTIWGTWASISHPGLMVAFRLGKSLPWAAEDETNTGE